jgi:hypothetical protein
MRELKAQRLLSRSIFHCTGSDDNDCEFFSPLRESKSRFAW